MWSCVDDAECTACLMSASSSTGNDLSVSCPLWSNTCQAYADFYCCAIPELMDEGCGETTSSSWSTLVSPVLPRGPESSLSILVHTTYVDWRVPLTQASSRLHVASGAGHIAVNAQPGILPAFNLPSILRSLSAQTHIYFHHPAPSDSADSLLPCGIRASRT